MSLMCKDWCYPCPCVMLTAAARGLVTGVLWPVTAGQSQDVLGLLLSLPMSCWLLLSSPGLVTGVLWPVATEQSQDVPGLLLSLPMSRWLLLSSTELVTVLWPVTGRQPQDVPGLLLSLPMSCRLLLSRVWWPLNHWTVTAGKSQDVPEMILSQRDTLSKPEGTQYPRNLSRGHISRGRIDIAPISPSSRTRHVKPHLNHGPNNYKETKP